MGRVGRTAAAAAVLALLGPAPAAFGPVDGLRSGAPSGAGSGALPASLLSQVPPGRPDREFRLPGPRPGDQPREFYFTRAIYSGSRSFWGGRGSWSTDFPKADRQFLIVLDRLVDLDAYHDAHPIRLDDPNLRRFPFLYALEVGGMSLTPPEVEGLRDYLLAGGFLVIDDFWGVREWENFEYEMRRVLPDHPIREIPLDHPVFHVFYDIEEIVQVPNVRQGMSGGPTWESGGITPHVRGIFGEDGRLMVIINFNTDLGDAWEWAENPYYPLRFSTFAIQMAVNMIVYGMSH